MSTQGQGRFVVLTLSIELLLGVAERADFDGSGDQGGCPIFLLYWLFSERKKKKEAFWCPLLVYEGCIC